MSEVAIRRAAPDDVEALVELVRDARWSRTSPAGRMRLTHEGGKITRLVVTFSA